MKMKLYIISYLSKTAFINIKHNNTIIKKLFFNGKCNTHYKLNNFHLARTTGDL